MNGFLNHLLVGFALCASMAYASFALGPRSWRRLLVAAAARLSAVFGLRRLAERLRDAAAHPGSGGCGSCGDCGKIGKRR